MPVFSIRRDFTGSLFAGRRLLRTALTGLSRPLFIQ